MPRRLVSVTILVPDYNEGIAFFCDVLGFTLVTDEALSPTKRWVLVAPNPKAETRVLLARADGSKQKATIGNQLGGRVGFILETDDFSADYAQYRAKGLAFEEEPRDESYGTVAVFADPWGNRWDLIEFNE